MIEDLNQLQIIKNSQKQSDPTILSIDRKIKILKLGIFRKKILIQHLSKLYDEYHPIIHNDIKQIKYDFYQN